MLFYQQVYNQLSCKTYLAFKLESIRLEVISDSVSKVSIGGVPLENYQIVHILNFPRENPDYFTTSRHELYRYAEFENAFRASLYLNSELRVINPGLVLSAAGHVFDKFTIIRKLHNLGWATPHVESRYDFTKSGDIIKSYYPMPNNDQLFNLILTQKGYYIDIDEIQLEQNLYVKYLISKTQEFLAEIKLDFCCLPMAIINSDYYAFGFSCDLPTHMGIEKTKNILSEII